MSLRRRVPDELYRHGKLVESFEQSSSGVKVAYADGTDDQFDVLVGADGYRSQIRTNIGNLDDE